MTIIPEEIKTEEEAMHWLMRHGYSEDLAKEEVAHWTAPPASIEEIDEDMMDEIEDEEEEWEEDDEEEWTKRTTLMKTKRTKMSPNLFKRWFLW